MAPNNNFTQQLDAIARQQQLTVNTRLTALQCVKEVMTHMHGLADAPVMDAAWCVGQAKIFENYIMENIADAEQLAKDIQRGPQIIRG